LWLLAIEKKSTINKGFKGGIMKVTEQELAKRNMALENAIASHRLEGLEPDTQTIEDLKCVVRGEFGVQEWKHLCY
jgi:hypothetical protein